MFEVTISISTFTLFGELDLFLKESNTAILETKDKYLNGTLEISRWFDWKAEQDLLKESIDT